MHVNLSILFRLIMPAWSLPKPSGFLANSIHQLYCPCTIKTLEQKILRGSLGLSSSCAWQVSLTLILLKLTPILTRNDIRLLLCFFFLFISYFSPLASFAKPFIPINNSQILETLSTTLGAPILQEVKRLKEQVKKDPNNLTLVLNTGKRFIEIARQESDPRYLGYTESLIKPWIDKDNVPSDILIISGTIKQSNHNFHGAIKDLDEALKKDPTSSQAWLTKALILQTIGDYDGAKKSCGHLIRLSNELVSASCLSSVSSLNGQAFKSYSLLSRILDNASQSYVSPSEKLWAITLLAEIGERIGENQAAERYFNQALELNKNDNYLLAAYADFLLNQKKYQEVISLLKDKTKIDNLLLRLTLAENALGSPSLKDHIDDLKNRFNAAYLRGDNVHLREEAIFTLKLLNKPKEALTLAERNWEIQKEPLDAQVFLESAIATNDKQALKPVLEFIERNKLEDKRLEEFVE